MSPSGFELPDGVQPHYANGWAQRPLITPRLLLIHTNGASVESTLQAQLNWANAAHDNTHPHYVVDRKGAAWKTMPSNRKGIAAYQADPFTLSIETTDLGWPNPGGIIGFTYVQAETIARIIAMESELWGFPIETPTKWDGAGVASHTDPFTYPYWTKYQGKTCPGPQKKSEVRSIIMPLARELRYGTPVPPPVQEDNDMPTFINERSPVVPRLVGAGSGAPVPVPGAKGAKGVTVNITATGVSGFGYVAVSGNTGRMPETSVCEVEPGRSHSSTWTGPVNGDGAIDVYIGGQAGVVADVLVDVQAVWS